MTSIEAIERLSQLLTAVDTLRAGGPVPAENAQATHAAALQIVDAYLREPQASALCTDHGEPPKEAA